MASQKGQFIFHLSFAEPCRKRGREAGKTTDKQWKMTHDKWKMANDKWF